MEVCKAEYDDSAFGSWFIDFWARCSSKNRIMWDGRDARLVLQVQRDAEWQEVWAERERERQTVDLALAHVRSVDH